MNLFRFLLSDCIGSGLNGNDFRECLDTGRFMGRVKDDLAEGMRIGITRTPGNLIIFNKSGEVLMLGNLTLLELMNILKN